MRGDCLALCFLLLSVPGAYHAKVPKANPEIFPLQRQLAKQKTASRHRTESIVPVMHWREMRDFFKRTSVH